MHAIGPRLDLELPAYKHTTMIILLTSICSSLDIQLLLVKCVKPAPDRLPIQGLPVLARDLVSRDPLHRTNRPSPL